MKKHRISRNSKITYVDDVRFTRITKWSQFPVSVLHTERHREHKRTTEQNVCGNLCHCPNSHINKITKQMKEEKKRNSLIFNRKTHSGNASNTFHFDSRLANSIKLPGWNGWKKDKHKATATATLVPKTQTVGRWSKKPNIPNYWRSEVKQKRQCRSTIYQSNAENQFRIQNINWKINSTLCRSWRQL